MSGSHFPRFNPPPVNHPVTVERLVADARAQRERDPCLALLIAGGSPGAGSPFRWLAEMELPASLSRWLSHMHGSMPALYAHSLRVSLVAIALATTNHLHWTRTSRLAMAGLCHDLGHLKIEALAHGGGGVFDAEALYQLRSHPVISHLILSNMNSVDRSVAQAVREHHERLDGSGYPSGLCEAQISLEGQLLALAEAVVGILDKGAAAQLPVKLRLQSGKFHARSVSWLTQLFHEHGPRPDVSVAVGVDRLQEVLLDLDGVLEALLALDPVLFGDDGDWLKVQVRALRVGLISAGVDPAAPDAVTEVAREDESMHCDLAVVVAEARMQLRFLVRESAGRFVRAAGGLSAVRHHPVWAQLESLRTRVGADLELDTLSDQETGTFVVAQPEPAAHRSAVAPQGGGRGGDAGGDF